MQAWAKGIAVLSLDAKFAQRRLQHIEFRPARDALQGLTQGSLCLRLSLWSAATGFCSQTASGLERGGALGGLAGFLRALLGCVFKPAIGVLDFLSKACEGVKNTVSVLREEKYGAAEGPEGALHVRKEKSRTREEPEVSKDKKDKKKR